MRRESEASCRLVHQCAISTVNLVVTRMAPVGRGSGRGRQSGGMEGGSLTIPRRSCSNQCRERFGRLLPSRSTMQAAENALEKGWGIAMRAMRVTIDSGGLQ
jgi:hypothetical protein